MPPKEHRTPRVVELLRKALEWQALLESGQIANQANIARREGITSAPVTQIMGMLRLASKIQEHVLSMPDAASRPLISVGSQMAMAGETPLPTRQSL